MKEHDRNKLLVGGACSNAKAGVLVVITVARPGEIMTGDGGDERHALGA